MLGDFSTEKRQFRFHSCLGRGGFGEVYRATMLSAGGVTREVAIKVLHEEATEGQAAQRLKDEGRMLGALRHPAILEVYDLVLLDGRISLVTEYVEGQDFDKCIKDATPLSPRAVTEVIGGVAEAFDAAWNAPSPTQTGTLKLIHRDIKPANIRIGKHGSVKLLDFGVARASNVQREAQTATDAMVGSFLYMAPECFTDNQFGPMSDIYALGATLYEGLSGGKRLFEDCTLKDIYMVMLVEENYEKHVLNALNKLPRTVPAPVVALLEEMLAVYPAHRPDAAAVARRCEDMAESLGGDSLKRWCKQRHWAPPRPVEGILDGRTITEATFDQRVLLGRSTETVDKVPDLPPVDGARTGTVTKALLGLGVVGGLGGVGVAALLGIVVVGGVTAWMLMAAPEPPAAPKAATTKKVTRDTGKPATGGIKPGKKKDQPKPKPKKRSSKPKPKPTAPAPAPSPAPSGELGTVAVQGQATVELHQGGKTLKPGRVPAGDYDVYADFGSGFTKAGSVRVRAGGRSEVRCSKLRRSCSVD